MKTLGITTSTSRGGAAVLVDGRLAGAFDYDDLHGHAERIFGAIDGALAAAGLHRRELELVACDVGPGSFTGVRVGVATSKGIARGLSIPSFGVGSLEALSERANRMSPVEGFSLSALDAKRGELYVALLDKAGLSRWPAALVSIDPAAIAELISRAEAIASAEGAGLVLVGEWPAEVGARLALPSAEAVARLAEERFAKCPSGAPLEPLYVRAPDAKLPSP